MAHAAEQAGDGGMLAVLGGATADAERIAETAGVWVANDNATRAGGASGPADGLAHAAARREPRA